MTTSPTGPQFVAKVAALNLPGIGDACYDVEVHNGVDPMNSDLVWKEGDHSNGAAMTVATAKIEGALCASQYGNGAGGDIAYVGSCDADTGTNSVTLWVENLYEPNGDQLDPGEWDNPYPPGSNGSTYTFPCLENQDTNVTFNLVVIRDANQGFFDVAVNFANVFCSGKVDTCDKDGKDNNLLFTSGGGLGGAGVRTKTAVIAFACTGGSDFFGNNNTALFADDINVTCADNKNSGVAFAMEMNATEGNQWSPAHNDGRIQWAIYRGIEGLNCGPGNSCNKLYWNAAIALDPTQPEGDNCTIHTNFTVGSMEDPSLQFGAGNFTTPVNTRYPIIDVNVQLTANGTWVDDNASDPGTCVHAQLGEPRVHAFYTETNGTCLDSRFNSSPGSDQVVRGDPCQ